MITKRRFSRSLKLDITDTVYTRAKRVLEDFEINTMIFMFKVIYYC